MLDPRYVAVAQQRPAMVIPAQVIYFIQLENNDLNILL